VCGNICRIDFPSLVFDDAQISFDDILEILLFAFSKEKCSALLIKDLQYDNKDSLSKHGFEKFSDSTMTLKVDESWRSFDDYLAALSKKYKQRARKVRAKRFELTVKTLTSEEVTKFKNRIGELFHYTSEKQVMRIGITTEEYFVAMKEAYGESFFINCYFLGDRLIAFASHFVYEDMLEVHYIGIDYTFNNKYSLYFNILFDGVDQAILLKKNNLELGRTALEAKAMVGCTPVYFNDYLFVKNRFIRRLVQTFQEYFQKNQGEKWKGRHPFRTEY
jgi:predicted N-acyltransferase